MNNHRRFTYYQGKNNLLHCSGCYSFIVDSLRLRERTPTDCQADSYARADRIPANAGLNCDFNCISHCYAIRYIDS